MLFNEVDGPLGSDSFYSATVVTAQKDTQVNELRKTFKYTQTPQLERTDTSTYLCAKEDLLKAKVSPVDVSDSYPAEYD